MSLIANFVEYIKEITDTSEGVTSYWILSNDKTMMVPNFNEHADVVVAHPAAFRINPKELKKTDALSIVNLAVDRGAIRVTYAKSGGELYIMSKYLSTGILDLAVEYAPGNVEYIYWDTFTKAIDGTLVDIYDRL
jgi:hypothetical protein